MTGRLCVCLWLLVGVQGCPNNILLKDSRSLTTAGNFFLWHERAFVCMPCVRVGARGQCWVSFLVSLHFPSWDRISH